MRRRYGGGMRHIIALLLLTSLAACSDKKPTSSPSASKAELVAHEAELLKLTLTPEAQRRLGLVTVRASGGSVAGVREVAGEIVVPPSRADGVPTSSTTNLQQIGSQQAAADAEVGRASAQLRLARIALARAEGLVREEAGSVRARDEAAAALAAANAAAAAARAQRQLLGPPVASLGSQASVWVRVSVFGSDVSRIRRGERAMVRTLGTSDAPRSAMPVRALPSANAAAGTVDLYYALSNRDGAWRVGQRVAVTLSADGKNAGLTVPSAAVLRDIYGGEWVYQKTAANTFVRQRVEIASEADGQALLARGLSPDAEVVTNGAAELFGTEFGAAH